MRMGDRQTSNGDRRSHLVEMSNLASTNGVMSDRDVDLSELCVPLQYGDIVLLQLCNGYAVCSHEDSRGSRSVSYAVYVYCILSGSGTSYVY